MEFYFESGKIDILRKSEGRFGQKNLIFTSEKSRKGQAILKSDACGNHVRGT